MESLSPKQKNEYQKRLRELARTDGKFYKGIHRLLKNSQYSEVEIDNLSYEGFELAKRYATLDYEAYERAILEKQWPLFMVYDIEKRANNDKYVLSCFASVENCEKIIPRV